MAGGTGRTESTDAATPPEGRTRFGQFAVVNASELLERLAYYGVLSVTGLFLRDEGYTAVAIGILLGILLPLPYVVPLLAAPLAARRGYKPVMLASFVGYASGFLLILASSSLSGPQASPLSSTLGLVVVLAGIVLVGIGAGLFKPLTAAAIGLLTSLKHRNIGYSIYYVGINVGGFFGPLLLASWGEYWIAYLLGAVAIAADFLLILVLFRNPLDPQPGLPLSESVRPFREVLANRRFLALLAIFSGFWFVYSMALTWIIPYLQDFVERPGWFRASWQVSLEALCVMVLGVPLGALANRVEAVRTMAAGITLLVAGFLLVGFFPSFPVFVTGVVLIAAGEVLAYPGFLSYVSRIAPPDRVAVYQGVGFLPLFVGFLFGPMVAGSLYGTLVDEGNRPALFWAIMASVGVCALAALLVYAKRIRPADAGRAPRWQGIPAAVAVVLLGVAAVAAAAAADQRVELAPPVDEIPPLDAGAVIYSAEGTSEEGGTTEQAVAIPGGAGNVSFILAWTDEPAASPVPGATNQPDEFRLEVFDRFNTRIAEASGTTGSFEVEAAFPGSTEVTVAITLLSAGDTVLLGQPAGADTGNAWGLTVSVA